MGLKKYLVDKDAEVNGKWFEFDGFRVLIGRGSRRNPKYLKEFRKIAKNTGLVLGDDAEEFTDKAVELVGTRSLSLAASLVYGWETMVDGEYVPGIEDVFSDELGIIPFNEENLKKTFEALPDLPDMLLDTAARAENFLLEKMESQAKN